MSKAEAAKTLFDKKEKTVEEIARLLGISRTTVYRYLKVVEEPRPIEEQSKR